MLAAVSAYAAARFSVEYTVLQVGGLVAFGVAVTVLMTWYHGPLDQVSSRTVPLQFYGEGLTFTTSLLCSFGISLLAGLLRCGRCGRRMIVL